VTVQDGCFGAGYTFNGAGTTCGGVTCAAAGACCLPNSTCISTDPVACQSQAGIYWGNGVACGSVACAPALSTTYVSNNNGGTTSTMFMDVTVNPATNPAGLRVTSLDLNMAPETPNPFQVPFSLDIYITAPGGSYLGNETNPNAWTLVSHGTGTTAGRFLPSRCEVQDFLLPPGTSGLAIRHLDVGPAYSNTTAPVVYSNSDLSVSTGEHMFSNPTPFIASSSVTGRVWGGTFHYGGSSATVAGACCMQDGTCQSNLFTACQNANGVFHGAGTVCAQVTCTQPGACCNSNGTCSIVQQSLCFAQGGTYNGAPTCAAANCPTLGACCSYNGTCSITLSTACYGTWQAAASCATVTCALPPPVVYSNCNLATGATTLSGVAAPAGTQWSEVARDETNPSLANASTGGSVLGPYGFRQADDFVVPTGGMNIAYLKFPLFQPGATDLSIKSLTVRIWDRPPSDPAAVLLFGDTTTNRLANLEWAPIYRVFNTVVASTCEDPTTPSPDLTRQIQWAYAGINHTFPAGTYWVDVGATPLVNPGMPGYMPGPFWALATDADAIGRQCTGANSNAMSLTISSNTWGPAMDIGAPQPQYTADPACGATSVQQDYYFQILGSPLCYANCDGSTQQPVLNVADFTCFLQKYAAGSSYANCDGSTQPPVLNVADFTCFLQKYAAGCH
jgi:hypothetical protein